MTELLQKAFLEASRLPEPDQDALAAWILEEIASERRRDEAFARSADVLARMAEEALEEDRRGRTKRLVPDEL